MKISAKILITQYFCKLFFYYTYAQELAHSGYTTNCDSALPSLDLWQLAKPDLLGYIEKAAQRSRLRSNGLDDCLEFCHTFDLTDIVPVFEEGFLVGKKG